jgi:hypothetical protein
VRPDNETLGQRRAGRSKTVAELTTQPWTASDAVSNAISSVTHASSPPPRLGAQLLEHLHKDLRAFRCPNGEVEERRTGMVCQMGTGTAVGQRLRRRCGPRANCSMKRRDADRSALGSAPAAIGRVIVSACPPLLDVEVASLPATDLRSRRPPGSGMDRRRSTHAEQCRNGFSGTTRQQTEIARRPTRLQSERLRLQPRRRAARRETDPECNSEGQLSPGVGKQPGLMRLHMPPAPGRPALSSKSADR